MLSTKCSFAQSASVDLHACCCMLLASGRTAPRPTHCAGQGSQQPPLRPAGRGTVPSPRAAHLKPTRCLREPATGAHSKYQDQGIAAFHGCAEFCTGAGGRTPCKLCNVASEATKTKTKPTRTEFEVSMRKTVYCEHDESSEAAGCLVRLREA